MKVISPKNLPTKLPIGLTALVYLLMDKFHPAGWVYGVVYTIVTILWIVAIASLQKETHTDIFGEGITSKWIAKLNEIRERNKQ